MSHNFGPPVAICRRDMLLYLSYRTRFVSTLITAFVGITLFYYVSRLVNSPEPLARPTSISGSSS